MFVLSAAFASLVVLCLSPAPIAAGQRFNIRDAVKIEGNSVLSTEVFIYVLEHSSAVRNRKKLDADAIQRCLLSFLRRTGYLLANVTVTREGGVFNVLVDEGRIEKIVFTGRGTFRTIQLKLAFSLPEQVFNSYLIERQLRDLTEIYRLPPASYRVVPNREVKDSGFQLDKIKELPPSVIIPKEASWDLYIDLRTSQEWDTGTSYGFSYSSTLGAQIYWGYKDQNLLFRGDRWRVLGDVGGVPRKHLADGSVFLSLSKAALALQWFTPDLGLGFRPFGDLSGSILSDQRRDMDMDIYYRTGFKGTLNMGYEVNTLLSASLGGGLLEKRVFGIKHLASVKNRMTEYTRARPLVHGGLDFNFDRGEARSDRGHKLNLALDAYLGEQAFTRMEYRWGKTFELGWHDLFLGSRGILLTATPDFDEDVPVGGNLLRAVFVHRYYVSRAANMVTEFRVSLLRDVYKLSIFHDLGVFGEQNRLNWPGHGGVSGASSVRVADSTGVGVHALILDTFQFNFYLAAGFSSEGIWDYGFTSSFEKVF